MPQHLLDNPIVGLLVEPGQFSGAEVDAWTTDAAVRPETERVDRAALDELAERKVDVVALVGGDAFIGEVLSVYQRHFRRRATPLRFYVMRAGSPTSVADALGAPTPSKASIKRLEAEAREGKLERHVLPTLRVTSSVRPAADLGFSFGAGLWFELFEAYERAAGGGLGGLASVLRRLGSKSSLQDASAPSPDARVSIDRSQRLQAPAYLLASTLKTSWLGLKMSDDRPQSLRMGESGRELIGQVARNRAVPRMFRSEADAQPFETLHIDWSQGYVLDGELYEPARPYVVQLAEGPPAPFVTL